jgi:hypothetical protein
MGEKNMEANETINCPCRERNGNLDNYLLETLLPETPYESQASDFICIIVIMSLAARLRDCKRKLAG